MSISEDQLDKVNLELKKLRKDVVEVPIYRHHRKNIIHKALGRKRKKVEVQSKPHVIKAPKDKLKYDLELAKVNAELNEEIGVEKVKVIQHISHNKLSTTSVKKKSLAAKLFSVFDILSPAEKEAAKREAFKEVKIVSKRLKAPDNELAHIEQELKN